MNPSRFARRRADSAFRQETLEELTRAVAGVSDSATLRSLITRRFMGLAGAEAAWFVEFDTVRSLFSCTWSDGGDPSRRNVVAFPLHGPLLKWFHVNEEPLHFPGDSGITLYLSEEERHQLEALAANRRPRQLRSRHGRSRRTVRLCGRSCRRDQAARARTARRSGGRSPCRRSSEHVDPGTHTDGRTGLHADGRGDRYGRCEVIRRAVFGMIVLAAFIAALVVGTAGPAARAAYSCCGNRDCDTLRAATKCSQDGDCRDLLCSDGVPCATCCDDACAGR